MKRRQGQSRLPAANVAAVRPPGMKRQTMISGIPYRSSDRSARLIRPLVKVAPHARVSMSPGSETNPCMRERSVRWQRFPLFLHLRAVKPVGALE